MDHWGDPWADDADTKSPTKSAEVKTLSPTQTSAPVLLNGFLDDAGWGASAEEDDFGGWASSTRVADEDHGTLETRVQESEPKAVGKQPESDGYNGVQEKSGFDLIDEGWDSVEHARDVSKEQDNVVSEASDSATTIQPDETRERMSTDFSDTSPPDDDLSTRPSTSPSDISHTDAPTESPRTSFEDERNVGRNVETRPNPTQEDSESAKANVEDTVAKSQAAGASDSDEFGDFEEDEAENETLASVNVTHPEPSRQSVKVLENDDGISRSDKLRQPATSERSIPIPGLDGDRSLITQLFPPIKASEGFTEPPEDPIHSTSTRKAWYRLTRKQTMREFNSGGDENNYVRVTWANSRIRTDVSKIVSRWANEDRISGRGPGSRASFFWDQSANAEHLPPVSHFRNKSTIAPTASKQTTNNHAQPLATNVPAAFDWSSPSTATQDPWKQDSEGGRGVSSPLAAQPISVPNVKSQEKRPVSMDLASTQDWPPNHQRTVSLISPIPPVLPSPPPVPAIGSTMSSEGTNSWEDLSGPDSGDAAMPTVRAVGEDNDDDDWGEMVQSPTIATPVPAEFSPRNEHRDTTPTSPTMTAQPVKTLVDQPTPPKHASPIVRLKGTVSPTSAIFGPTSYVPASVEQGPIGPGLLKPTRKTSSGKPSVVSPSVSSMDDIIHAGMDSPTPHSDGIEDFAAFEKSSTRQHDVEPTEVHFSASEFSASEKNTPLTEPTAPTLSNTAGSVAQSSTDPWAEADFSFFESPAPPPTSSSKNNPLSPSDPFSVFEMATTAPPPFTRAPQRPKTPPPQMPLTGATNSAQRRKAEEDEIIRIIVQGLPDLGYMLRR